eukprot:TRINITY_DN4052_c0_g2_i3.p2 TRINITY_DN4052_c0_g2~~TRINITY_DN4052_c0_g2_i3.p2  ORF type:complete len:190 (-),score=78.75 TRINITY_DN4052_c0_g2_i3:146-715(-)
MKVFALFCIALVAGQALAQTKWAYYSQCDPKWADDSLGSRSICAIGCLMSSVAMALTTFNRPCGATPCTPKALNSWLRNNGGFSGNLFVWGSIAKLGLNFEGWDTARGNMKAAFKAGKIVILNVNGGRHWVLMIGEVPGGFKINDPGYNKNVYADNEVVDSGIFKKTFFTVEDMLNFQGLRLDQISLRV